MKTLFLPSNSFSDGAILFEDCSLDLDDNFQFVYARHANQEPLSVVSSSEVRSIITSYHNPPKTVFISCLDDTHLILDKSIPVTLEFWDNYVTAFSYDLEEYGVGSDELEALRNIRISIADLYFILKEQKYNLGPVTQKQWDYLENIIKEK